MSSKLDGRRVTCVQDPGWGKGNAFPCSATSREVAPLVLCISKPGALSDVFLSVKALLSCYTHACTLNFKLLSQGYSKMAALKWKHHYEVGFYRQIWKKHLFFFFTFVLHEFLQSPEYPEYDPDLWQLQATVWGVDKFILQNICSILISSQCPLWARGRGKRSIRFPSEVTI